MALLSAVVQGPGSFLGVSVPSLGAISSSAVSRGKEKRKLYGGASHCLRASAQAPWRELSHVARPHGSESVVQA